MKKRMITTYSLITLVIGSLLSGCSDFLDLKPKGKEIPTKFEHYSGLLNNTMFSNLTVSSEPLYMVYMGDELIADASSFASLDRVALGAFKYEADIFNIEDHAAEWNAAYQQIYSYNVIANGVMDAEDGTYEEKLKIQAEARVGRAYMHFLLAQYFSKPYNEATASSDCDESYFGRAEFYPCYGEGSL